MPVFFLRFFAFFFACFFAVFLAFFFAMSRSLQQVGASAVGR